MGYDQTSATYSYNDCIFEQVFVETPVDSDHDGYNDLVSVYIRRPKTPHPIPVIYVANPYMHLCNEDWYTLYDVDGDFKESSTIPLKEKEYTSGISRETKGFSTENIVDEIPLDCITDWYSYFNCRGYATVFCGGLGTKGSQGYTLTGSSAETQAFKAVIDWLNGRCKAFTDKENNIEIKATWCSGNVAMTGKSYLATMAIAIAMTGVEGLKTIIPEAGISNWYDYYRYNGLCVPAVGWQGDDIDILAKYCFSRTLEDTFDKTILEEYFKEIEEMHLLSDRDSGNYNDFWHSRNYLDSINKMTCSAYIVCGLQDFNVKSSHCYDLYKAMKTNDLHVHIWLHQGDHIYVHDHQSDFTKNMHQWLDYYLYGIGTISSSVITVQDNIDQLKYHHYPSFPLNKPQIIPLNSGTYCDTTDYEQWLHRLIQNDNTFSIKTIIDMTDDFHISGPLCLTASISSSSNYGLMSAMVVDLGEDNRISTSLEVVENDYFKWGTNSPTSDLVQFKSEVTPYKIISRGWLNLQNRNSNSIKEDLVPHQFYNVSFDLLPTDYRIKKGNKLAIIIYGVDYDCTIRLKTPISYQLQSASIKLHTI